MKQVFKNHRFKYSFQKYLKLFIFLFLPGSSVLHTQQIVIDTTLPPNTVTYEYAFAQFNTFQATSGYLIDRSFPFGKMEVFSGDSLSLENKGSVSRNAPIRLC